MYRIRLLIMQQTITGLVKSVVGKIGLLDLEWTKGLLQLQAWFKSLVDEPVYTRENSQFRFRLDKHVKQSEQEIEMLSWQAAAVRTTFESVRRKFEQDGLYIQLEQSLN